MMETEKVDARDVEKYYMSNKDFIVEKAKELYR